MLKFRNIIFIFFIKTIINQSSSIEAENIKNRQVEEDILKSLNVVRRDPKAYLRDVVEKERSKYTEGDGLVAFNSLVEDLKVLDPLPLLSMNLGLRLAAYYHSVYMRESKKFSHTGKNGSRFSQRLEEYGTYSGGIAENIFAGSTNGDRIVLVYLVDVNIPSRGHRKNILNKNYLLVGNGVSGVYSTMDFAAKFDQKSGLKPLPGTPNENGSGYTTYSGLINCFLFIKLILFN